MKLDMRDLTNQNGFDAQEQVCTEFNLVVSRFAWHLDVVHVLGQDSEKVALPKTSSMKSWHQIVDVSARHILDVRARGAGEGEDHYQRTSERCDQSNEESNHPQRVHGNNL